METFSQFCIKHPALAKATENLRLNKRLRRMVMDSVLKLEGATSKRDLAKRVIADITSNQAKLDSLFSQQDLANYTKSALIWNKLDVPITLSVNVYNGVLQKSNIEASALWAKASKSPKLKHAGNNFHVMLSGIEDNFRCYVTDPTTPVAIVDNLQPNLFLGKEIKDREKFNRPRQLIAVKVSDEQSLLMFADYTNSLQKRYIVSNDVLKGFDFQPIGTHYVQQGTTLVKRDFTGEEFNINKFGELLEERDGLNPECWVIDACNRGRKGDVGIKGDRGQKGNDITVKNLAEVLSKMTFTVGGLKFKDPLEAIDMKKRMDKESRYG